MHALCVLAARHPVDATDQNRTAPWTSDDRGH
jgi:hypothetical protein